MSYEGRRSLVGKIGEDSGRSLVLNGHVDVVSAEPLDRWTKEPFGAEVADGRMYGRGSCDMKGGVAAMLLGVEAALAAGPLPGRLVYQSVIEEECGGNGALAAVLAGPPADAALIAEPTNGGMDLVAVGVIWARITLEADSRHASNADRGSNPIEAAYPVIQALHRLEAELNADPEPEVAELEQPYLLNVGALHAGDWPSMTPGRSTLDVRLGFPIRMEPAEAQERLAEAVRAADPAARVEFRGFRARGYSFDPESPFVRLLGDCHEEAPRWTRSASGLSASASRASRAAMSSAARVSCAVPGMGGSSTRPPAAASTTTPFASPSIRRRRKAAACSLTYEVMAGTL